MPWIASEPLTLAQRRALIADWTTEAEQGGDVVFGIFCDAAVAGGAGLHRRNGPDSLEIGYWVHPAYLRRGIATTAARLLTDAAFTVSGIERVEIPPRFGQPRERRHPPAPRLHALCHNARHRRGSRRSRTRLRMDHDTATVAAMTAPTPLLAQTQHSGQRG